MNNHVLSLLALMGIVIFAGAPALAQLKQPDAGGTGQGMQVTADKLTSESGGNKIEATGNVEIKRQQTTIKADEVGVDRQTQDVEAKGKVFLDDPEWKVKSADAVQMNLEKETGEIQNGDLFIEQGRISATGRRFQKFGGQTYHIDAGFFTTCLCDSGPSPWRVSAEEIDINRDGLGIIRNGYFYIYDVPVFYLPYAYFPLKTERQTGFLFPTIGNSNKDGVRYMQPFFWAISKSTDATIAFDVESKSRVGLLGEFRTIFDRESDFQLRNAYFNESLRTDRDVVDQTIADTRIPISRWSIIGTHRYPIASDWLTYSDFAAYSDTSYTRELVTRFDLPRAQEGDMVLSRYGRSRFGAFRSWGDTYFNAQSSFYQDFIQFAKTTLQGTPELSFWGRRFLGGFPLEFRWNTDAVNYWRREGGGSDGLRLDLRPEFIVPFNLSKYAFGSFSVAPRETAYHLYRPVQPGERNISREIVEIRYNVGSSLNRVFAVSALGLNGFKHVIEPELSYLFVPGVNQSAIPIMDSVDRIERRNVFTFAVTNRLWGKLASNLAAVADDKDVELLNPIGFGVQDIGSLRLALSYDFYKTSNGGNANTPRPINFSDVDINLRLNPASYVSLRFDGGVSTGPWQVTQARATVSLSDPRPIIRRVLDPDFTRPNSFSLSYQFLRDGQNGYLSQDANINLAQPADCVQNPLDPRCPGTAFNQNVLGSIGSNMFYHLTDHILLSFSSYYDLINKTTIGLRGGTKYLSSCECWTVTLNVSQTVNPARTGFNFNFNLLGLGSQSSRQNALR